jgi:hypothetical protein
MNPKMRRSALSFAGLFFLAVLMACACGGTGAGALLPTPTLAPTVIPPTSTTAPLPTPEKTAETGGDTGSVPTGSLDGVYAVAGSNPDGSEYEGTLTITAVDDIYNFAWDIGGTISVGSGILFQNYIAVGFPYDACSTALYAIGDNSLPGLWVAPNDSTLNTETATLLEGDANSDILSFTLEGTNPDGSTYTGGMALTKSGDLYTVAQSSGDTAWTGTGISNGELFAVSYGEGEGCGVALYTIDSDGVLSGPWGVLGQNDNLAGFEAAAK